jgi:hypothetical protein
MFDGNFKQQHMKLSSSGTEVVLADGLAYFVPRSEYRDYISYCDAQRQARQGKNSTLVQGNNLSSQPATQNQVYCICLLPDILHLM